MTELVLAIGAEPMPVFMVTHVRVLERDNVGVECSRVTEFALAIFAQPLPVFRALLHVLGVTEFVLAMRAESIPVFFVVFYRVWTCMHTHVDVVDVCTRT